MDKFWTFFVLTCFVAYQVNAICCPWKPTPDIKCQCDDGEYVHPWECCATGACNIFCCNCGGDCRKSTPRLYAIAESILKRFPRDVAASPEALNSALHFHAIDSNQDNLLSLDESLRHLELHRQVKVKTPAWFESMDTNKDGSISPSEFDGELYDGLYEDIIQNMI